MSRCFPFPPPGYEKKARTDDVDLLKKEKHREKKHKKEKKDKEKREDKDRKEKDRSNGKHRDKKERSKEKKKDKEREKDRDKTSTSHERKISAHVDSCNGDHKLNNNEKEVKDQNITPNEKKQSTPLRGYITNKPVEKFNEGTMDMYVLDLCNRINDEGKGSASQPMERSPFTGRTNHDRMARNENGIISMEKEKKKDTRVDDIRKMDEPGVRVGAAISATRPSTLVQNFVGKEKIENKGTNVSEGFQNRAQEIPRFSARSLVQNIVGKHKTQNGINTSEGFYCRVEESPTISERSMEPRDKKHKEDENRRGSKRKDKDKEKKSHGKDKEKKKEEKVKEKNAQKIKGHDEVKDSNIKNGFVVNQNIKLPPLVPDGNKNLIVGPNMKLPQLVPGGDKSPVVDGNLKKRKDSEANGFLHESNSVPNKKPRPTPRPSIENGRKMEPCQAPVHHTPDRKALSNLIKANNNEHKVNGKIEAQSLSISLKKPSSSPSSSSSSRTHNQISRVPVAKPSHSDTMDQIAQSPVAKPHYANTTDQISQAPWVKPPHPDTRPSLPPSSSRIKADQISQAPVIKPPHPDTKPSLPSSSSRTKPDQISQAPVVKVKPPHPDTKYLSEVLSVPKIDQSYDFEDEEWLFSSKNKVPLSSEASETPRVWDKAMRIETADVYALPYVIPY